MHTLSADLEWEKLAGNDPSDRTPRAGEEKDINAYERNSGLLRRCVLCAGNGTGDGNDELTDTHADGSHEKKVPSAHLLNEIQTGESRRNVDAAASMLANSFQLNSASGLTW